MFFTKNKGVKKMGILANIKSVVFLGSLSLTLVACNTDLNNMSSEEIYNNVVQSYEEPVSYYAESFIDFGEEDSIIMKEWRNKDNKIRTEAYQNDVLASIAVNDGKFIWSYDAATNEVLYFELDEASLESLNQPMSEQAKILLDTIKESHTLEVIGEDKVANRDTLHVKATPKNNVDELIGELEVWIDKETWFMLKSVTSIEDYESVAEYTTFEVNPKLEEELFVFETPEGATLVDMDEMFKETKVASIEEARTYVEKPFLYLEETDSIKLNDIVVSQIQDIEDSVNLNYFKEDLPYFSLIISPIDEENVPYKNEFENIRGQEGIVEELSTFKMITWVEDGYGYVVLVEREDVTVEEVIELLNTMVLTE